MTPDETIKIEPKPNTWVSLIVGLAIFSLCLASVFATVVWLSPKSGAHMIQMWRATWL